MRQIANNTFNDGMLMDMQPLTTPNSVLTDCLNGTLITYDGNEFVLQSDDGNGKIYGCKLPKDFIPLGMKEYGGIVYIVSQNPFTGECEIGSFPSPEKTIFTDPEKDIPKTILTRNDLGSNLTSNGISNQVIKLDFGNIDSGLLRPGDKFAIYLTDEGDSNNKFLDSSAFLAFESLLEKYEGLQLATRNLFKLKLVRISADGVSESIKEIVPRFKDGNTNGRFYYNKIEILENENPDGFFAVYNNKINGYLAVILELEQVDEFNLSIGNTVNVKNDSEGNADTFNFDVKLDSTVSKQCKNNICGVELKATILNSDGSVKESKDPIYLNIQESLENWYPYSGQTYSVPPFKNDTETVHIEDLVGDFDVENNIKVEITPYSKFNWFNSLKYENILNYDRLTSTQESLVWKYYLDKSMNIETTPDKMMLSFDFFVRGTRNKRNKLDALYIEFYDVIANASFFYPIQSIADSKTVSLDCFTDLPVKWDPEGGMTQSDGSITTRPYYMLINKNKVNSYNQALSKIDKGDTSGYDEDLRSMAVESPDPIKKIPSVWPLESLFRKSESSWRRYNNLGIDLKEQYSKLRTDNFYIVAICGLDFYEKEDKSIDVQTYVSYNFLWTNGIFNKYWQLSGGENDNFNLKKYPDFLNIGLKALNSSWTDSLSVGELSSNHTSDDPENGKYSFQSYEDPFYPKNSNRRFDTRINVNGEIERSFKVEITPNKAVINYGNLEKPSGSVTFEKSALTRSLLESEFNVVEDNTSDLETNSKAGTITISDGSGGTGYNPEESMSVKISLFSNRKVEDSGMNKELNTPAYTYQTLGENYNIEAIRGTDILNIRARGSKNHRWMTFDVLPEFKSFNDDDEVSQEQQFRDANGTTIGVDNQLKTLIGGQDFKFVHLEAKADHNNVTAGYSYYLYNPSTTPPANTAINYNNDVFLLIRNSNGLINLLDPPFYFLPLRFSAGSNYKQYISKFNEIFRNDFYVRRVDNTATEFYWVPNEGLILNHGNFDSKFNFNPKLLNVKVKNTSIKTLYKGIETSLDLNFYNARKAEANAEDKKVNIKNIGRLFNEEDIDLPFSLPYQKSEEEREIILEDNYTLKNSLFILIKDNTRLTIGNIVEDLRNPEKYLSSDLEEDNGSNYNVLYVKDDYNNPVKTPFRYYNGSIEVTQAMKLSSNRIIAMYDSQVNSKIRFAPLPQAFIGLDDIVLNKLAACGSTVPGPF